MATYTTDRTSATAVSRGGLGNVIVDIATYEATGEAIASVIQMVKVQAGDTVFDGYLVNDALGGSTTLDVGDGDSTTRWISAASTSSAAFTRFGEAVGFPRTYTADDTIDIVTAGGTVTGTITLVVYKTRDSVDLS